MVLTLEKRSKDWEPEPSIKPALSRAEAAIVDFHCVSEEVWKECHAVSGQRGESVVGTRQ